MFPSAVNAGLAPTNSVGFGSPGSVTCRRGMRLRASNSSSCVVPSLVWSHVTASVRPSGENATRWTSPLSIWCDASLRRVAMSHSWSSPNASPNASRAPLGSTATV